MKKKQGMIHLNSTIRSLTTLHPVLLVVVVVSLMIVPNADAQVASYSSVPSQSPTETNICDIASLPTCQIDFSFLSLKEGGRKGGSSSKNRFSSSKGKGKGGNAPTDTDTMGVPICIADTCQQDTDNIDAINIASYETVCVDPRELVGSTFSSNGGGTMMFMNDEEKIVNAFISCGCCPGYRQTDTYPNYCIESTIRCTDNNGAPPTSPTDTACMIPEETCESGKGKRKSKTGRFSDANGTTRQRKLRRERYNNTNDEALPSTATTTTNNHEESSRHRDLRYALNVTGEQILSSNDTAVRGSSSSSSSSSSSGSSGSGSGGKGKSSKGEEERTIMGVSVCFNGQEFCLDPLNPKEVAFASTDGVTCGGCN